MLEARSRKRTPEETGRVLSLLARYGGLLTARQMELVSQHYNGGKTLTAIAREQKVSRQAIHDAVRQAKKMLEQYEEKLGGASSAPNVSHEMPAEVVGEVLDRLEKLRKRIAHQGIIYSVDWIVADLQETISLVGTLNGKEDHSTAAN
jgi:predicted DNA-binding protein YlxM (UPF0122 family)